jgi:hypothetical protein
MQAICLASLGEERRKERREERGERGEERGERRGVEESRGESRFYLYHLNLLFTGLIEH